MNDKKNSEPEIDGDMDHEMSIDNDEEQRETHEDCFTGGDQPTSSGEDEQSGIAPEKDYFDPDFSPDGEEYYDKLAAAYDKEEEQGHEMSVDDDEEPRVTHDDCFAGDDDKVNNSEDDDQD